MNDTLLKYRNEIDEIDDQIITLFEKRMNVVKEIGMGKKISDVPILNTNRENEVISKNIARLKNNKLANYTKDFTIEIMKESKLYQDQILKEYQYGLLGRKLSHSYSPMIHTMIDQQNDLPYLYGLIEKEENQIQLFIDLLKNNHFKGINVTIPYKETIVPFLDEIVPLAKKIGSVNTIKQVDGRLIGYNTDYYGFSTMLEENQINVNDKVVYVLGTGGSSKMVITYLYKHHAKKIIVVSRDENKIQQLKKQYPYIQGTTYSLQNTFHGDILINTTPLGMNEFIGLSPVSKEVIKEFTILVDLIYNPMHTKLIKDGQELGLLCVNGLSMLVHQAYHAKQIWLDQSLSLTNTDLISKAVQEDIKKNQNIVLIGMPGAGKSTIAKLLSKVLHRECIHMDEYIEEKEGKSIIELFKKGQENFRKIETDVCIELSKKKTCIIDCGGGVILNPRNMDALQANGLILWIDRDIELILETIDVSKRPLLKDDPHYLYHLYQERIHLYKQYSDESFMNNQTIDSITSEIAEYVKKVF